MFVVDRSAVVRIDKTKVPQFIPLINIRNARSGQFHQRLREGVVQAALRHFVTQLSKVFKKRSIVEYSSGKGLQRVIVGLVRIDPTGVFLGLFCCFAHIVLDAPREDRAFLHTHRGQRP